MFPVVLLCLVAASPVEPADSPVRAAVERSLPVLLERSLAWKERAFGPKQVRCVSCHHLPMTVWTHNEAAARGFAFDRAAVHALADHATNHRYEPELVDGYLDTVFLSHERSPPTEDRLASFAFFRQRLIDLQLPDGSWMVWDGRHPEEPGMQVVWQGAGASEEAKREATEVDTLWTLLGLAASERVASSPDEHAASLVASRRRALSWLDGRGPPTRNDWLGWRMLVEQRHGTDEGVRRWRELLIARQNGDGGWGMAKGDDSHPLVTGQCLYALAEGGAPAGEPIARGRAFLLGTQSEDGTWPAASRVKPDHSNDVTVQWGTAWATLGLLSTLPAK